MKRETIQDYLEKSGMEQQQADTLSRILDEMATRSDILALEEKLDNRFALLGQRITDLDERMKEHLGAFKAEMRSEWEAFRSEMRSEWEAFRSEMHSEWEAFRSEMRSEREVFRSEARSDGKLFKSEIRRELKAMEARLSWRFFGGVLFLAALITLLDKVVG